MDTKIAIVPGSFDPATLGHRYLAEQASKKYGKVLCVAFINPEKEYGWFMGNLHGAWSLHNWILSCFNGDILVKAPLHTSAYNIWWWIGLVFSVYSWIKSLLLIIINIRIIKNAK